MTSWYDTAQVCLNGHPTNDSSIANPEHNRPFCPQCGQATITNCPKCNAPIRGDYHVPSVVAIGFTYSPPSFCDSCGHPYPWTERHLAAARALADDLDELSQEERGQLKETLPDLVADTPMTNVAAQRFKRLAAKAGRGVAESFREVLVGVASEAAKKAIWG